MQIGHFSNGKDLGKITLFMNLSKVSYPPSGVYRHGKDFEPIDLFLDALPRSKRFDLLLGYFSSSAIKLLSTGFAMFLYNGGKLRMVTNHIYSSQDKLALLKGVGSESEYFNFSLKDYKKIKDSLDSEGEHFFNCIAWLISKERIDVKVIKPKTGGISHPKEGLFFDGTTKIHFHGSMNFTAAGLVRNVESISTRKSYESEESKYSIKEFEDLFESYFNETNEDVEYLGFGEIEEAIIQDFGNKDIQELLEDSKSIGRNFSLKLRSKRALKLDKLEQEIEEALKEPRFPYESRPRGYQIQAYQNWVKNSNKGIFAMATGTGKTLTSLNCLLNIYKNEKKYRAVVLVPTIALVNQWKEECRKFNFRNIICVSSKYKWKGDLSFINTASKFIDTSFIVIVTYASFPRRKFQNYFKTLPNDTLLIADEMHNIGSPKVLNVLDQVHLEYRIGLSATPKRQYDEIGNQRIRDFFTDAPPYTFSYSMDEAINKKPTALCPYMYFPHIVYLNETELKQYIIKSKQLMKYFDSKTGKYKDCTEVEMLLLQRKRIIHKAQGKKLVFQKIVKSEFKKRGNLKFSLVYVPEGDDVDYGNSDEYIESNEDSNLLNQYTKVVRDVDFSVTVKQFTSNTKNRDNVLTQFSSGETDVLCSMKCLDEGVDVPRSELAIFCASTGNSRQFIQRRGRVLRKHIDKDFATIHDLVVIPKSADQSTFEMEKGILKKELERVVDFSKLSLNKVDTYKVLKEALDYYKLNLNHFE